MPLQSSGQISMSDIAGEKPTIMQDMSLSAMSSLGINSASSFKPNGTAPHAISEFYGYDHYASSGPSLTQITMSSQTYPNYYDAMILCGNNTTKDYWHDGTRFTPGIGDRIYTDSFGSSTLRSRHVYGPWGEVITTDGAGYVNAITLCESGDPGGEDPIGGGDPGDPFAPRR